MPEPHFQCSHEEIWMWLMARKANREGARQCEERVCEFRNTVQKKSGSTHQRAAHAGAKASELRFASALSEQTAANDCILSGVGTQAGAGSLCTM